MKDGISFGRIFNVPVVLSWSWFLIAAVIVFMYGPFLQNEVPRLGASAYLVAFGYAVLLLFSILVHELAHAVVARSFGWPVSRIVLHLWGGHTSFESVATTPGRSLVVALVGPMANLVVAGLGWVLVVTVMTPGSVPWLLATVLTWANLLIAIFNLLPGLPLDGGRLVESLVWKATGNQDRGTIAAGWAGRFIAVALVALVLLPPLFGGPNLSLWTIVIGVLIAGFLWVGATAAIRNGRLRSRMSELSAGRLATRAVGVPARSTVAQLRAARADLPSAMTKGGPVALVLINEHGVPTAVVDDDALDAVDPVTGSGTAATAVARALVPGAVVPAHAEGQQLVQYLARLAGSEYVVIDAQGVVCGVLTQSVVVAALTDNGQRGPWEQ